MATAKENFDYAARKEMTAVDHLREAQHSLHWAYETLMAQGKGAYADRANHLAIDIDKLKDDIGYK